MLPPTQHRLRPVRHRRGVGLPELLIALAITAALLTAVAAALDASFQAYRVNQEQADLMQRSRLVMHRLLGELRNYEMHRPAPDDNEFFQQGLTVPSDEVWVANLDRTTNRYVGFRYYQDDGQLLRQPVQWVFDAGGDIDTTSVGDARVIATGLGDSEAAHLQFTIEPMRSNSAARANSNFDLCRRITVRLNISDAALASGLGDGTGKQKLTSSASVVPRRNVWAGATARTY
jgi:prepilin-type N-terminal cleavage/methylation domain-containing protein